MAKQNSLEELTWKDYVSMATISAAIIVHIFYPKGIEIEKKIFSSIAAPIAGNFICNKLLGREIYVYDGYSKDSDLVAKFTPEKILLDKDVYLYVNGYAQSPMSKEELERILAKPSFLSEEMNKMLDEETYRLKKILDQEEELD